MDELNNYITFRYNNWLDYANHMSIVHNFEGWAEDLLNECMVELLKKDQDLLLGLLARKTRKIVNGKPTTELDKFVLKIMHLNAFSPVAPFRKNTLGHKVINRKNNKVITARHTRLNGHDQEDENYDQEFNDKIDNMHDLNISRLTNNGFSHAAINLYKSHFIKGNQLKDYTDNENASINEIKYFLQTRKTLLDD